MNKFINSSKFGDELLFISNLDLAEAGREVALGVLGQAPRRALPGRGLRERRPARRARRSQQVACAIFFLRKG